mgnify:FL=1
MKAVLIWTDIGNYHAARSRSLSDLSSLRLDTVEVLSESSYIQFRACQKELSAINYHAVGLDRPVTWKKIFSPLEKILTQLRPGVVFVPGWSMVEALAALQWCGIHAVPAVIMTESNRIDSPRRWHEEKLKKRIVSLAAAALVGGTPQAEYVKELGMPEEMIFSGYDVVDNDHFAVNADAARHLASALREKHHLPQQYLLCCARLVEKKNLSRLIQAFRLVIDRATAPDLHLVIVGPGPLEAELLSLVETLHLSGRVHLKGAKSYDDMPAFYGLAEALILPSTTEQWGLVVNEAMAAGLPVLVSQRCGSSVDLVREGDNGFTFDPYDVQAIANAIERIFSPGCDRSAMGKASRKIIADWGLERFATGFEAAAKAAVSRPKRRAGIFDRMLLRALASR